jgi:hypothetical protein
MQQNGNERVKFAVVVRIDHSNTWYRGPRRFDSKEAAEEYAWNEYQLHSSYKEWRVLEMPDQGDADGTE